MDINNNTELEYLDLNTNVLTKNDVLNNVDSSSNKVVTSKGIFDAITQNVNQLAEYVNENYGKKITSLSIDVTDISDSVSTISGKVDVVDNIVKRTIKNVIIDISANISRLQNNVNNLLSDMYVLSTTTLTSIAEDVKILTNDIYVNGVKSDISSISNYISGKVDIDIQRISVELSNFLRIDSNIECLSSNMTKYVDTNIAYTNNKIDKTNNDVIKISTTIYDDDGIIADISNLNVRNAFLTKSIYSKDGLSATLSDTNKKISNLEDALYNYDYGLSNKVYVLQEDVSNVKDKILSIDNDLKTLDTTLTPKVDSTIAKCNDIEKEITVFKGECKDTFKIHSDKICLNSLSILAISSDLNSDINDVSSVLNTKIKDNTNNIDDIKRRIAIDYATLDKKIDDNEKYNNLILTTNELKFTEISTITIANNRKIRALNDYVVDKDQNLSNAIDAVKTNIVELEHDISNISNLLSSDIEDVRKNITYVNRKVNNIKTDLSYDITTTHALIRDTKTEVDSMSKYVDSKLVIYENKLDAVCVSTTKNSEDIIKLSSQISGTSGDISKQVGINTTHISELCSSFNTISGQMTELIEANVGNISTLSSSFNTISSQMTELIEANAENITELCTSFNTISGQMSELIESNTGNISELCTSFNTISGQMSELIESNTGNISELCLDVDKKLYTSDFSKTLSAYLSVVSEIPSEEELRKHPDVFYFVIGK